MELLVGHTADCDAALLSEVPAEIRRSIGSTGATAQKHPPVATARRDRLRL
jgi:hypothetical protein